MSDLWTEATYDAEAEKMSRLVVSAKVAVAEHVPFLTAATSAQDYANRKALITDRLDQAVATLLPSDPVGFGVVRSSLEASLDEDYRVMAAARAEEARVAALETAQRRQAQHQAAKAQARRITAADFQKKAEQKTAGDNPFADKGGSPDPAAAKGPEEKKGLQRQVDLDPETQEWVGSEWEESEDPAVLVQSASTFGKNPRFKTEEEANAWAAGESETADTTKPDATPGEQPKPATAAKTAAVSDLDDAALDKELRRVMEQQNNTRSPEAQESLRSFRRQLEDEQKKRKGGGSTGSGQERDGEGKFASKTAGTRFQDRDDNYWVSDGWGIPVGGEGEGTIEGSHRIYSEDNVRVQRDLTQADIASGEFKVVSTKTAAGHSETCSTCHGTGQVASTAAEADVQEGYTKCSACNGTGSVWVEETTAAKTATLYCTKHEVYVGDGNRDTHAGEDCKVEQRKSKDAEATLKAAAVEGWWPRTRPSAHFPGEMELACPKCGGPVILQGVYGPGGRLGDTGGGTMLICADCNNSQFFPAANKPYPYTGSRKTASWVEQARQVVTSHQFQEVDGVILDATTASMLVQVYDAVNEANKAKFEAMPLPQAVDFGWKLLNKATASKTADLDVSAPSPQAEAAATVRAAWAAQFGASADMLNRVPDDQIVALWNRLMHEDLPPHLFDDGSDRGKAYQKRAAEVLQGYLMMNTGSRLPFGREAAQPNPYSTPGNPYVPAQQPPGTPDDVLDGPTNPAPVTLDMPKTTRPRQMPSGDSSLPTMETRPVARRMR